ncbi:hypothetical protein NQ315_004292 [Exocentrus adspersus]|uniref:Uncharacterized protein n=1 Tax=Exocentrus adspersus TaxID=1586481 RepID=A0AAV8W7I0_9CUCU|nr:hypothetical protein NQ315_004292 [Exocentrus adspersus]
MILLTFWTFFLLVSIFETSTAENQPKSSTDRFERDASSCCTIPFCEEVQIGLENHNALKCYSKIVCGERCRKNVQFERVALPFSPYTYNYRIRNHYIRTVCESDKCSTYQFDCSPCPSPSYRNILAYGVHSDCLRCYY